MEIKVVRVYEKDTYKREESKAIAYVYSETITYMEQCIHDKNRAKLFTTFGEVLTIDESITNFKSRLDGLKEKEREEERRNDLGLR